MEKTVLLKALGYIPVSECNRETWLRVGMALKAEGLSWEDWDKWSSSDPARYRPGECRYLWNGFNGEGVTGATIVYKAKKNGWVPDCSCEETGAGFVVPPKNFEEDYLENMLKCDGSPYIDLRLYLEAVYKPDDIVPVFVEAVKDNKGKWGPGEPVFYKCSDLVSALKEKKSVRKVIGKSNPEAGAWIGCNAFDGRGRKLENVVSWRFTLIECDLDKNKNKIPYIEQLKMLLENDLPIAAVVCSGGKSLHAVVHIDAESQEQYVKRVRFMHEYLSKIAGMPIDPQTKPANRTPRLPGVLRAGEAQYLVGVNLGPSSYKEWVGVVSHV